MITGLNSDVVSVAQRDSPPKKRTVRGMLMHKVTDIQCIKSTPPTHTHTHWSITSLMKWAAILTDSAFNMIEERSRIRHSNTDTLSWLPQFFKIIIMLQLCKKNKYAVWYFPSLKCRRKSEMLFLKEDSDGINAEEKGTNTLRHKHNHPKVQIFELLLRRPVIGPNEDRKRVIMYPA